MTTTPAKVDLVTLTIDGVEVSVPKDTLVIRAAEQVGVQIPRFCDHPLLAPVGACRQCLVDVPDAGNGRPIPKPQASCTLTVAEGMVVSTQATSPVADKAQQGVMEFLLVNHPLDCPVCDKGGECPLQNQAMSNGRGETRFEGVKRTFPKPINLSAQVLLDRERCIVCQRCTRFSDEIAGDPFIALIERGAQQQIGIADDAPFLSYFSGNTIQICPVGALTSAEYRFRSRPFDLVSTPGVAEHDACGAAIRIDHRRGKVMRRLAGNDPEVNEEWISDKDRFAFHYARQDDRITYPMVREDGELRPASWPEAFAVAARGLHAAGSAAVLTGGRVSAEDAYAYAKFARVSLGTNDVDFRARPHSAEEADFLAAHVALSMDVTYDDLERASVVVLAGLEPEDEAATIFLRLRKASKRTTKVVAIAPYATRGLGKMGGRLIPTAPGQEVEALRALAEDGVTALDSGGVILVGERLAQHHGALTAAVELARTTGARLAWVPRRAGDRGAVEAGCLPTLLPGGRPAGDASARVDAATAWGVAHLPEAAGRDADAIVAALTDGSLGAVVVGGVDPDDTTDPAATLAALDAASFVVSLELRETEVTRRADVVLPVAPVTDKAGTFVTWEGRPRPFEAVFTNPGSLPDLRVLAGISDELAALGQGSPLGFRTVPEVRAEMEAMGPWDGERPAPVLGKPPRAPRSRAGAIVLSTWKQLLDGGSMQDGDPHLAATRRPAVARVSPGTLASVKGASDGGVVVTGDRGEVRLPVEVVPDMVDGVVWLPTHSHGRGLLVELASPGSTVTLKGAGQ
ncbi:NADH-quinone oxidoreductase subunit G [Nocardioides sp. Soil805]|uniref:NADH-quinone oxidoreductase subunit G n=1 Tax=Nocardioides sp. Soil805 TaxID=1736416 RepID=UPI000702CF96|nr:NADH-quinone oxidoreductase subunit G [Nocardioides sp. Soil805]KRF37121.1 NADH-quinone oxidoreductase subunit G [Nocardioides sp. Soil805]